MSTANDLKLFCETILHFDEKGLKKFNFSRKDLYAMWTKSFVKVMKENMKDAFSKNHASRVGNAIVSALKKVVVDTKDLSEGKVEVTITGLNVGDILADKNLQIDVNPDASKEEVANSVIEIIEKKFDALQPTRTMIFVVDCVYSEETKMWQPLNMNNFMPQLFAGALGNR